MFKFISKFIPVSIQVKTLYWSNKEKEMAWDLTVISGYIDEECYDIAETLVYGFRKKWESQKIPNWLAMKVTEVSRLEAMNNMLKEPLENN